VEVNRITLRDTIITSRTTRSRDLPVAENIPINGREILMSFQKFNKLDLALLKLWTLMRKKDLDTGLVDQKKRIHHRVQV
jgi:hypothetical protein